MTPDTVVSVLKGVGKVRAQQLSQLGITTLKDLISYFPRTYEDRSRITAIKDLVPGSPACFPAKVTNISRNAYIRRGMTISRCTVSDESGSIRVTWFNQPWITERLIVGNVYYFYGSISDRDHTKQLLNPVMEAETAPPVLTRRIIPVYPLTAGLSSKMLQQLIGTALSELDDQLTETLPVSVTSGNSLMNLSDAYREVHQPTTPELLQQARNRMVFEEFFRYCVGLSLLKEKRHGESHYPCSKGIPDAFFEALPFRLTNAQSRTLQDISEDLCSGKPLNRLVQGDVGSGKTMVALGAILQAVENGYQAALMAPTELLATQHYHSISKLLEPLGISCVLLTGSTPKAQRRRIEDYIAIGSAKVVIGTHALFTDTIDFYHLGLVVIDEQHRFGVRQRAALAAKGNAPHMLVLSATPIPRTLALILYGDLDISIIDELPPGREEIDTFLVNSSYRTRLNGFIQKQLSEGHQVYVVCPAVEENEETDLTSAEEMYKQLCTSIPDARIGLVHGKLRSEAKDYSMAEFQAHRTDILVATTVIEVGVDVPNATLMIIENADRFGLSQLHQLRGRVGRGQNKSWCVLVSDTQNPDTLTRLKTICATADGFEISRQDLAQRGPGDFFGQRQSGLPVFQVASLANDLGTLQLAQSAAKQFLEQAHDSNDPSVSKLFEEVHHMFTNADNTFN